MSCPSASFCAIVDVQGDAWTISGNTWRYAPIDGHLPLTSVSCPTGSFCVAVDKGRTVGYESYPGGHALSFDGGSWSAPVTIEAASLVSVSCPSLSFCVAMDYSGQALIYSSPSSASPPSSGAGGGSTSGATAASAPVNLSLPTVSGTKAVGLKLSSSTGVWSGTAPISYSYQWQLCAPGCSNIAGATASSLMLSAGDAGKRLRVLVTAANSGGSTRATSREAGPVGPSSGQIRTALLTVLGPSGKSARIGQLLKHGSYSFSFMAPSTGRLAISWYQVPRGAQLTRAKKPVLVARSSVDVHKPGRGNIKIVLTASGRKLLNGARRLKLTTKATFTPTGQDATSTTKTITLTN